MAQGDIRETAFNYIVGEKTGTFYTSEQKWINRIKQLAKSNPDQIIITHENEDDGSILAEAPINWFKFSPPRKISDKQKEAASKRFSEMWAKRKQE